MKSKTINDSGYGIQGSFFKKEAYNISVTVLVWAIMAKEPFRK
jgi:hypothetical protein